MPGDDSLSNSCSIMLCFSSLGLHFVCFQTSDGSVVSFQKTAVAVGATVAVFLKTVDAVVLKLTTAVAVAVIIYNCNLTKN